MVRLIHRVSVPARPQPVLFRPILARLGILRLDRNRKWRPQFYPLGRAQRILALRNTLFWRVPRAGEPDRRQLRAPPAQRLTTPYHTLSSPQWYSRPCPHIASATTPHQSERRPPGRRAAVRVLRVAAPLSWAPRERRSPRVALMRARPRSPPPSNLGGSCRSAMRPAGCRVRGHRYDQLHYRRPGRLTS